MPPLPPYWLYHGCWLVLLDIYGYPLDSDQITINAIIIEKKFLSKKNSSPQPRIRQCHWLAGQMLSWDLVFSSEIICLHFCHCIEDIRKNVARWISWYVKGTKETFFEWRMVCLIIDRRCTGFLGKWIYMMIKSIILLWYYDIIVCCILTWGSNIFRIYVIRDIIIINRW